MYYRDKKKRNKKYGVAALIILAVLMTITPMRSGVMRLVHAIGNTLTPLQFVLADTVTDTYERITRSKQSLLEENKELQERIIAYEIALLEADIFRERYDALRDHVGIDVDEYDVSSARVLVSPHHNPYRTMIINKGLHDDVAIGDVVSFQGVVALGRVVEVFNRTAHVQLFSDVRTHDEGVTIPAKGAIALARGVGSGIIEFEVARDEDIHAGDYVAHQYTDLIMAVVGDIIGDPRDPVRTVVAHMPISLSRIQWVHIHHIAE